MAMTEERRGEIALAIVKARFRRDGLHLSQNARRELGTSAKETGIPMEELQEFLFDLLPEMIGDAFGYEHVSVTARGRKKVPPQARAGLGDLDR